MAITQLSLYNQALSLVGERKISIIGTNTEAELLLDVHYEEDPTAANTCLELIRPEFAMLTANLTSPATPTNHGLSYEYTLPANYVSLFAAFSDSDLSERTERYILEDGTIASDIPTTMWIRYIRNDANLTDWTPSFAAAVIAYMALQIAPRFAPQKIEKLEKLFLDRVEVARTIEDGKRSRFKPIPSQFTSDVTVVQVYNQAIAIMGLQDQVQNPSHESTITTALDAVMANNAVDYLLTTTKPKFATTTTNLTVGPASSEHDLDNVFTLPADYLSLVEVHSSADMDAPLKRYMIEGSTLACNFGSIHLRYVTDSVTTSNWTPLFKQLLAVFLAEQVKSQFVDNQVLLDWIGDEYRGKLETFTATEGAEEPMGERPLAISILTSDTMRKVYNGAMGLLGRPPLQSVSDEGHERRQFDLIIENNGIEMLLEMTKPRFACRTVELDSSVVSTEHGYDNVFTLPSDYLSFVELHSDEKLDQPINRYLIEDRTLATEYSTVYLRYISNDYVSGAGSLDWTPSFQNLVSAYLADQTKARFADGADYQSISDTFTSRLTWIVSNESAKELPRSRRSTATLTNDWRNIYNDALMLMGLDRIVSNTDDSERRSTLDATLDTGVVATVLEDVNWSFAAITQKLSYNPSYEPEWGYKRGYDYPDNMHRLVDIFTDEYQRNPLKLYASEGSTFFCDVDEVYMRFVPTTYLTTPSSWPQFFKRLVAGEMALLACPSLGGDMRNVMEQYDARKAEARSTDAMTGQPQLIKRGGWSRARHRGFNRSNYNGRP